MARKNDILSIYTKEVEDIKEAGLFKGEAPFVSPQGARVTMEDGRELLCMCANNYLGLGASPRLIEAAKKTYDEKGYGVASVRFICGTQDIHKELEKKIRDNFNQAFENALADDAPKKLSEEDEIQETISEEE